MKLSQREKKLLWCLVNIGVLLLGVKWVFPKVNEYYQASIETLQANELNALQAEILLSQEKELPSRLEEYQKELDKEESYYFSKLDPEYMEAWIMGISQRYDINIGALNIEEVRMQDEEGIVEVLPIGMTLEGDEATLIEFLDALLNDNRHVVLEQLEMGNTTAQLKIAVYRTEKESDELDQTLFNKPLGKDHLMKPAPEESLESETEIESESTPMPEDSSSNLSALEELLSQLMRPNQEGSPLESPTASDENGAASTETEAQNKEETEGDGNEESAEITTETTQANQNQRPNQ